jgi:predicted dehydrogenase
LAEALAGDRFECALVCSAPLSHAAIIQQCLTKGLHVFTELNLVADGYEANMSLAKEKGLVLFLSSTFLYRDDVGLLLSYLHKSQTMLTYQYHVGQYLPDWHPWESYRDYFVSEKRTNGCREILAIELPWLVRGFGKVASFVVEKDNISSLPLAYPDRYLLTLRHERGHLGILLVDLVTRVPVRRFEVFAEDLQIEWRGKPEELFVWQPGDEALRRLAPAGPGVRAAGYRDFIVEDAYAAEIADFFGALSGATRPVYSFAEDMAILSLIDAIEHR